MVDGDVVDDCAQAILNEWRRVEPATAHSLAHMAAAVAARFYLDAVLQVTTRVGVLPSDAKETR